MIIIGLTGTIASGKSTLARYLKHHHLPVMDSDKIVHQLLGTDGAAVAPVIAQFGETILTNNVIDRRKLGQLVFASPEMRRSLEAILHPMVKNQRDHFIKIMRGQRRRAIFLDIPLLFETNVQNECDMTWLSWAPEFLIYQRALARDGVSYDKLNQILSAQMPQQEKMKLADRLIPTGLGHYHMTSRINRLLSELKLKTNLAKPKME